MMIRLLMAIGGVVMWPAVRGASADETLEQKLLPKITEIVAWAATPVIVEAVLAQNQSRKVSYVEMNEKSWAALEPRDPWVISFTTSPAGKFLRTKGGTLINEAFLNDAAGYKVAFISKTTHWRHAGMPKHDQPMAGKIWQGPVEMDQSSRSKQIQIAVPVLDHGKPVGSLVVGVNVFEIARE